MNAHYWVGYMEHKSANQLWSFDQNVGKGGYTIFGAYLMQSQHRNLQGLPWCATFIHAVIDCPDILGKAHPGCRVLQRRMKRKKYWRGKEYIPQKGDLIFLSNKETDYVDHCGIVDKCDGHNVTSIDGNGPGKYFKPGDGGEVVEKARSLSDPKIVGYAAIGHLL